MLYFLWKIVMFCCYISVVEDNMPMSYDIITSIILMLYSSSILIRSCKTPNWTNMLHVGLGVAWLVPVRQTLWSHQRQMNDTPEATKQALEFCRTIKTGKPLLTEARTLRTSSSFTGQLVINSWLNFFFQYA